MNLSKSFIELLKFKMIMNNFSIEMTGEYG